ncbi:MAG: PleD family two-component system response regulator [Actinomycetota bacterium]
MARTLIVDDDLDGSALFRRWLERHGHQVTESATGDGALRTLGEAAQGLVLLDVFLPGIAGYEVARRMAEDPTLAEVPVVMISISEKEDRPVTPNIKEWMLKPFTAAQLSDVVARHAAGERADG